MLNKPMCFRIVSLYNKKDKYFYIYDHWKTVFPGRGFSDHGSKHATVNGPIFLFSVTCLKVSPLT